MMSSSRNSAILRPGLRWMLAASVLAAALALWWPDEESHAVARVTAAAPAAPLLQEDRPLVPSDTSEAPLLERLPVVLLEKASFDPFAGVHPPTTPSPKPFVGPIYVPPPPPPKPPALSYRYLGRMTDPSGKKLHYLSRADKDVPVEVGTQLDEGYVVEAITSDIIRLHYPSLDARAEIRIPAARESVASP